MTISILFSTYLHDVMSARRMTVDELAHDLDLPNATKIETWLKGWGRPEPKDLPKLAAALRVDPVDLAVGWMADAVPELDEALVEAILAPRGSAFPRSTDLALRAPQRRPASLESMDVGDPHDRWEGEMPSRPSESRTIRRSGHRS